MSQLSLPQKVWTLFGIVAMVVVVFLFGREVILRPSSITVVGEGKVNITPEIASLVVARVNVGSNVTAAIDDGEKGIAQLMDIGKIMSNGDAEMQRSFYQITPQANNQYIVANAFSLKTGNVAVVNEMLKTLYSSGATSVSNITFTAKDALKVEQEARQLAVKDAKAKAQALAKSAGKRLGRLISVADDNLSAAGSVGSAGVAEGQSLDKVEIVKQVSVAYEIW